MKLCSEGQGKQQAMTLKGKKHLTTARAIMRVVREAAKKKLDIKGSVKIDPTLNESYNFYNKIVIYDAKIH